MAGVGERARNAHRVLRLREMGFEEDSFNALASSKLLAQVPEPEEGEEQQIGGGGHPAARTIRALKESSEDGNADDIAKLFKMSSDDLYEAWRSATAAHNKEIDPEGMAAAWESQERDLEESKTKPRTAEEKLALEDEEDEEEEEK